MFSARLKTTIRIPAVCLAIFLGPISFAEKPADVSVTGSRETLRGVTVVRVWGSAYERGFAQGYLTAEEIRTLLLDGMFNETRLKSVEAYESFVLRYLMSFMEIEPRYADEIHGIHDGMLARLGPDGMHVEWLGRKLSVEDFTVFNCFADFFGLMCSTFTVWGDLSAEGVLTARNLDYPLEGALRTGQFILVHLDQSDGRKSFVSINWPGQVGCVTAMNADGVTLSIHDTPGVLFDPALKYRPRLLQMRSAIETASGPSAFEDAAKALDTGPTIVGNNVHMSRPARFGAPPAAVLEYDGRTTSGPGVTVRTSADNAAGVPGSSLICTNHYRSRRAAQACNRYEILQQSLHDRAKANERIDLADARSLMGRVARRHELLFTLHTVLFLPDRGELEFSVCSRTVSAPDRETMRFSLAELLSRPVSVPGRAADVFSPGRSLVFPHDN